ANNPKVDEPAVCNTPACLKKIPEPITVPTTNDKPDQIPIDRFNSTCCGITILLIKKINKKAANQFSNWLTRSEEHTSELQSRFDLVCRLLLEKKKCHIFYR